MDSPIVDMVARPRLIQAVPVRFDTANFIEQWLGAYRTDVLYNRGGQYTLEFPVRYKDTYTATHDDYIVLSDDGVFSVVHKDDLHKLFETATVSIVAGSDIRLIKVRKVNIMSNTNHTVPIFSTRDNQKTQVGWASPLEGGVRTFEFAPQFEDTYNITDEDLLFGDEIPVSDAGFEEFVETSPPLPREIDALTDEEKFGVPVEPTEEDLSGGFPPLVDEPVLETIPGGAEIENVDGSKDSSEAVDVIGEPVSDEEIVQHRSNFEEPELPAEPIQVDAVPEEIAPIQAPALEVTEPVTVEEEADVLTETDYSDEEIAEFERLEAEEQAAAAGRHAADDK